MREKTLENFKQFKISHLSNSRRETIEKACIWFDQFCQANYQKPMNQILQESKQAKEPEEEILEIFQDWLNSLNVKVNSKRNYASGLNRYLRYHSIRIDLRDLEWPQDLTEERYAITIEEIREIINVASWKRKGFYLALISTGARPMEICGLRKKDFVFFEGKYGAIIPAHVTKKKTARTIFFSCEVTPYITGLIKNLDDDEPVFGTNTNLERARQTEDVLFRRYITKLGFTQKYESTGYNKINMYCFRGYFFTKALDHFKDDIAHAMIGHGAYLQQYQRRTEQQKKELWDELEPEILTFDAAKKDKNIEQLNENLQMFKRIENKIKEFGVKMQLTNERLAIVESELPNFKITRIRKRSNPKVLDPDSKIYV